MNALLARRVRHLTIGMITFVCLGSLTVSAAPPKDLIPLEDIIAKAKQEKGGRVVEAELDRDFGRYVYEVEIVDDAGVEWELKYDARTGKLLRTERDD